MSENKDRRTNVANFLGECNAGAFMEKLSHVLSEAGLAQVTNGQGGKKAKVSLEFTFQQVGENEQVIVSHKLATVLPTKRGKKSEEDITETPFFVGYGGQLTIDQPKEDNNGQFGLNQQEDGIRRVK